MTEPYYQESPCQSSTVSFREVLDFRAPAYGETSLVWSSHPSGQRSGSAMMTSAIYVAKRASDSLWCFGSMRMFLDRRAEFEGWNLSQDVVWEKHNGSGFATDRFRRTHEHALHWYRGEWRHITHNTPRVASNRPNRGRAVLGRGKPVHTGEIASKGWEDDGTRQQTSVIYAPSMHGTAIHPTEKPVGLLDTLIRYACPSGGTVLDPFAGSGSTAVANRALGNLTILVEAREDYCEAIARRLSQGDLFGTTA